MVVVVVGGGGDDVVAEKDGWSEPGFDRVACRGNDIAHARSKHCKRSEHELTSSTG